MLPIVCPHLNYSDLEIQDGPSAMEAWIRMIDANDPQEAEHITQTLLGLLRAGHLCNGGNLSISCPDLALNCAIQV